MVPGGSARPEPARSAALDRRSAQNRLAYHPFWARRRHLARMAAKEPGARCLAVFHSTHAVLQVIHPYYSLLYMQYAVLQAWTQLAQTNRLGLGCGWNSGRRGASGYSVIHLLQSL